MLLSAKRFNLIALTATLGCVFALGACGPVGGGAATTTSDQASPSVNGPSSGSTEAGVYKPVSLLWESSQKDGVLWSSFVYQIIGNDAAMELLPGTDDITDFCPAYATLDSDHRVNFWAYLISAIAKYESGYNPNNRTLESTLGQDAVTKLPVYSEGLLQLSYQDQLQYRFCDFDWAADKLLTTTSAKKTILDPFRNLECGTKILAAQVVKTKRIALATGVYWSTLATSGHNSKLAQIQRLTRALPFCAKN